MKNTLRTMLLSMVALLSMLSACKRDNTNEISLIAFEDEITARKESEDGFAITEVALNKYDSNMQPEAGSPLASSCAVISRNEDTQTIIIDFGTTGCMGPDGKVRQGKIIIHYTGRYRQANTTITTTLDNYYVNGNKIEGTRVVKNVTASGEKPTYSVEVRDAKILFTDGTFITWNAQHSREWSNGSTTLQREDDEHTLRGTSSGVTRQGVVFSTSISASNPLLIKATCRINTPRIVHPVSGELTMVLGDKATRILNYGNGQCDKEATVTVNGNTRVITLR